MTVGPVRHPRPRDRQLTDEAVYDLRVRALDGVQHDRLATEFGVSQSTMTRAVTGTTYRHVVHPVQCSWWEPGDPPLMRFLPYSVAQEQFDEAVEITAVIEHPAARQSMGDLLDALNEWERRDQVTGVSQQWVERIRAEQDQMCRDLLSAHETERVAIPSPGGEISRSSADTLSSAPQHPLPSEPQGSVSP